MYFIGVNGRLCVLMDEMECSEFWSLYADIDIMWVYVVGADDYVSFCLGGLSEKFKNIL
jgi:hypothetical protein